MKAIAFDLGDTLVEYEGVPLSWEAHYREALENLAESVGASPDDRQIDRACAVLRRYNTRINPREEEVSFTFILEQLLRTFELDVEVDELRGATAFFRIFRQELRCFPDTVGALASIRDRKVKIGVLTDVP